MVSGPAAALAALLLLPGCAQARQDRASGGREPVVGGRCEGCELVFTGMPERLEPRARIAPADEPGEPLLIEGVVRDASGRPAEGVVVYAYHTDAHGIYPRGETRHGRLRGWARTDEEGRYAFDSIRPASYPDSRVPAHVHMHVLEPGCCTYTVSDVEFTDDPMLAGERRGDPRGGSGVVTPRQEASGRWTVQRDIVLGAGIPGYASGE